MGFDTAAIELILPTYGEQLGLRGKICKRWTLNPHPTLIPAIETGWVESIHSFGGEVGMERYVAARPDIFFTGRDGSLRSNRVLCQLAGQYAIDMFIGSSLQIDARRQLLDGDRGTAGRLRRCAEHGPRPAWPPPRDARLARPGDRRGREPARAQARRADAADLPQGRPAAFVDTLDAVAVGQDSRRCRSRR